VLLAVAGFLILRFLFLGGYEAELTVESQLPFPSNISHSSSGLKGKAGKTSMKQAAHGVVGTAIIGK
jgi:hypothetical protein